jgi:hypothetical protein
VFGDRHAIVMFIVIERKAYLSHSLAIMTVMTVVCGCFLNGVAARLNFLCSLTPSP